MKYTGIMGTENHYRNGTIRWHCGVGAWLGMFAIFLNALASVVFAPMSAQAGTNVEWVQICSTNGISTVAIELGGETDEKTPAGGSCQACPLCPTHRDLENIGPALMAETSRVTFIPQQCVTRYFLTSEPVDPAAPYSSFLSRGPPLHV